MRNLFAIFFFLLNFLNAQNVTAIYELKYKPDVDKDSVVSEICFLDIIGKESIFRSEQARFSDSLKSKNGYGAKEKINFSELYSIKNLGNDQVFKIITTPLMNDYYFIRLDTKLIWEISNEKKIIGAMQCQKAIVQYGGRSWTAWFDHNIPIQEGPYIFHNLPGLIVKLSDEKGDYDFSLIEINNSSENKMFYQRKGKEISWDILRKLQKDYYSDPFYEIKSRNIKYKIGDQNGNPVEMNFRQLTENIQKQMRKNNNPIELNYKIDFK